MPAPLTGSDALLMRRLEIPRFRRLLPLAMIALGGFMAFAIALGNEPVPKCLPTSPCQPDPGSSITAALLVSVVVLAFLQPWLAALASVAAVAAVVWHNDIRPDAATNRTGQTAVIVVAVWCVAWAAFSRRRRPRLAWQPELARVPTPARPVRTWRLGTIAGLVLLAAGVGFAAYGHERIADVQAQERTATIVKANVVAHPDKNILRVAYPPGHNIDIPVVNSQLIPVYNIGLPVDLRVDDAGLRQLVTEPYDGSFLYAYALLFGLGGAGLALFSAQRSRPRRRLLRRPQPAAAVYVRRRSDHVLVFAGDAGPTDRPFAELPVRDDLTQVAGLPAAAPLLGNPMMRTPEPAVLHGTPIPGLWSTVTIGAVTLAPRGPLRTAQDMLPFGVPAGTPPPVPSEVVAATSGGNATTTPATTPATAMATAMATAPAAAVAGEESEPPLSANEISQMRADDAAAAPEEVRRHRLPRPVAYVGVVLVPLIGLVALRPLRDVVSGWPLLAAVVALVGLANYASWRLWFRPVVAWSGGGVTYRKAWRRRVLSVSWAEVSTVRGVGHYIRIDTYRGVLELTPPLPTRLLSGRTPVQLLLALRRAKQESQPGIDLPPVRARGDLRDAIAVVVLTIASGYALLAVLTPTVVTAG